MLVSVRHGEHPHGEAAVRGCFRTNGRRRLGTLTGDCEMPGTQSSKEQGPRTGHKHKSANCQNSRTVPAPTAGGAMRVGPHRPARSSSVGAGYGMPFRVVLLSLRRVGQHLVGFVYVLELQRRPRSVIQIGMVAPCQPAKGGVDLSCIGGTINLKHGVVVEAGADEWRHALSLF